MIQKAVFNIGECVRRQNFSFDTRYLLKWLLLGGLIGIVAGVGSILFFSLIRWSSELFMGLGMGYYPPQPAGEGETVVTAISRRWMIPVITTLGGLLSGVIVYTLAPEAEGHGTDSAIDAFHNKAGQIRGRIPLIKMVTAAITIGSGGSAGREGPTAQIAAGFGSFLGRVLKLSEQDRRIAMAAGIGAGIGAIFKAPLGGALLSAEVLYLEGFEAGVLVPSFIASIVGYSIFAWWDGVTPIFGLGNGTAFNNPLSLGYYVLLGVACGLVGILYSRTFYGIRDLFRRAPLPKHFRPALGGLLVGIIGMFMPQVLSMGYGWLQIAMDDPGALGLGLLVGLTFAKILATSLSIGSGGSGGVFAPGLFIGGMLGASLWLAFHDLVPYMPESPIPFVVVGMMALFGGVARAPLAVMLMVGEMTGSYNMLAPAMVAVSISYVITGRHTIYESQVESPAQSLAHRAEYAVPVLANLQVKDAMESPIARARGDNTVTEAERILEANHRKSVPVIDPTPEEHLAGIVSLEDVLKLPHEAWSGARVEDIMTRNVITVRPDDSLAEALDLLTRHDVSSLPVVEHNGEGARLVGMINRVCVAQAYTKATEKMVNATYHPHRHNGHNGAGGGEVKGPSHNEKARPGK